MSAVRKIYFLVAAFMTPLLAAAGTGPEGVETFLPRAAVTRAVYVQIERDPALDDFTRRMQEARERDPEWYAEYTRKHQTPDYAPAPYHENLGVAREEYEHFVVPMNHFRELSRTEIVIRTRQQKGRTILDLEGEDLLLTRVELDHDALTAETPRDVLPRRSFVDLERASLPPGTHRGVLFRTPDTKIRSSRRRESLLIGEVREKQLGIIHYSLQTPEGNARIYVTYR